MKLLYGILFLIVMMLSTTEHEDKTVYDFKLNSIDGKEVDMSGFQGHVLLIVNTASECGFTAQYDGLQSLYEKYKNEGFYVLGFPANNFGGQEPGTNKQIEEFCRIHFGVEFPMFEKVSVKGEDQHPLFDYLTSAENADFAGEIGWNFEKFLIDRNGNVVRRFKSSVAPESRELTGAVKNLL